MLQVLSEEHANSRNVNMNIVAEFRSTEIDRIFFITSELEKEREKPVWRSGVICFGHTILIFLLRRLHI